MDQYGPIQLRPVAGKGLGFIATAEIAPGDIVLSSTIFAAAYHRLPAHLRPTPPPTDMTGTTTERHEAVLAEAEQGAMDQDGEMATWVSVLNEVVDKLINGSTENEIIWRLMKITQAEMRREARTTAEAATQVMAAEKIEGEQPATEEERTEGVETELLAPPLPPNKVLSEAWYKVLQRAVRNNVRSTTMNHDPDPHPGLGLYPSACFLNHSCHPNLIPLINNKVIHYRAARAIHVGEEVCCSYINMLQWPDCCLNVRRQLLHRKFNFDCVCTKCCTKGIADQAVQAIICICGREMTVNFEEETWTCPNGECEGRTTDQIRDLLHELEHLLAAARGEANVNGLRQSPESSKMLLDLMLPLTDGFLGRHHGLLLDLHLARASAAQALGELSTETQYWSKCLDTIQFIVAPNKTDAEMLVVVINLLTCACKGTDRSLQDRVRFSKMALAMHQLAYGGGRALFDARYATTQPEAVG